MRWSLVRTRVCVSTIVILLTGLLGPLTGTARADLGPSGYDPTTGKGDVVCVGNDTTEFLGNFLADGSPFGHAGFNANGAKHDKLVSINATGDALARFSYAQTQTATNITPSPLDPTVILRAASFPAQRPNGSGAGYNALINDVTTTAQEKINCVGSSSLPTAQQYSQAVTNGWGGLHVVRAATDTMGIAAALTTNAPAGLSGADLVPIYQGVSQTWADLPGYSGPCPNCTIVPMLPQPGSGLRNTFLADLQQFNGGAPIMLGANVLQGIEENDPAAITSLSPTDGPNAIVPFSGSRLRLWNKGYFHNPHTAFNNNPFPGGAALSSGVQLLSGAAPDGNPSYSDTPGLYFVWRASDDNAPIWPNNNTSANWVHVLFLGTTSFLGRSITGSGPVNDAGASYAYKDCGIDPANCGLSDCTQPLESVSPADFGLTDTAEVPVATPTDDSDPSFSQYSVSHSFHSTDRVGVVLPFPTYTVAPAATQAPDLNYDVSGCWGPSSGALVFAQPGFYTLLGGPAGGSPPAVDAALVAKGTPLCDAKPATVVVKAVQYEPIHYANPSVNSYMTDDVNTDTNGWITASQAILNSRRPVADWTFKQLGTGVRAPVQDMVNIINGTPQPVGGLVSVVEFGHGSPNFWQNAGAGGGGSVSKFFTTLPGGAASADLNALIAGANNKVGYFDIVSCSVAQNKVLGTGGYVQDALASGLIGPQYPAVTVRSVNVPIWVVPPQPGRGGLRPGLWFLANVSPNSGSATQLEVTCTNGSPVTCNDVTTDLIGVRAGNKL